MIEKAGFDTSYNLRDKIINRFEKFRILFLMNQRGMKE
jgi:hypothetical protein